MQVAKYWRNNNLRYRLEGIVQNKVERKSESTPMKLPDRKPTRSTVAVTKADVA